MKWLFLIVVAIGIAPLATARAGEKKHSLSEDAALNLLLHTIQRDHVYDKRISLDCVTFDNEDTTRLYFQFAVRENHTAKCGGDPDLSPVLDRYRVYRSSQKIEIYDPAGDAWRAYGDARH
jgi:hypothetical protein